MASGSKRTIVVTGATRGCGRAMTERFIEAGHIVVGCGRSATLVKEMASRFDAPHRFDAVDVSDDRQVDAWAKSVIASGLVPDLLVNNAAINVARSCSLLCHEICHRRIVAGSGSGTSCRDGGCCAQSGSY